MPRRDVVVKLDMDRLRAFTGLSKAELPDDAPDERVSDVLTMSGYLTKAGRLAPGHQSAPAAQTASEDYDERWLTPQERAARDAAQAGTGSSDVAPGTIVREA
jgi:hypothetical protein